MQSTTMKISPFDLTSAIVKRRFDPAAMEPDSGAAILAENLDFVMVLSTSIAVLIGCVFFFLRRRSRAERAVPSPKPPPLMVNTEPDGDDGKKKVTIFFGTQTGTAEGFAKVRMIVS